MTPWDKDEEGLKANPPTEAEMAVAKDVVNWIDDRYVILGSPIPETVVTLLRLIESHPRRQA